MPAPSDHIGLGLIQFELYPIRPVDVSAAYVSNQSNSLFLAQQNADEERPVPMRGIGRHPISFQPNEIITFRTYNDPIQEESKVNRVAQVPYNSSINSQN